VHIIIINLDCKTDPCDVHSRALTALVTATALLRASIEVWQNVFIDTPLKTAAWLAHLMLIVRSMSARIKAIFISGMSP